MKTPESDARLPSISVFTVVRNGIASIERCIESILAQDYPDFEVVVQDGGSTDGTVERLQRYGSRIRLRVEPDKGPAHAIHLAISRCRGELVIGCMADEELLPGALRWGARQFAERPDLGAVYGDFYQTDLEGKILNVIHGRPWDYRKVLCSEYLPCFSSAFFRREALTETGLYELDPDGYEGYADWCIWWRVGLAHPVAYRSGIVSKFAVHAGQLCENKERLLEHLEVRKRTIGAIMAEPVTPPEIRRLHRQAIAGCHLHNVIRLLSAGEPAIAAAELAESLRHVPNGELARKLLLVLQGQGAVDAGALPLAARLALRLNRLVLRRRLRGVRRVALFGTGYVARSVTAICAELGIDVAFYMDNSSAARGGEFLGRAVLPPEVLMEHGEGGAQAVVLATLGSQDVIGEQLRRIGFRGLMVDPFDCSLWGRVDEP